MKLNESSRGLALQSLLKQKLGWLFEWEMPAVTKTVGPYDVSVFQDFDEKRVALVQLVQGYLVNLSNEDIDKLADRDTPRDDEVKSNWLHYEHEAIRQMRKYSPPWYAGGFGHQQYKADYQYWAQMPSMTNHESLLLSLGVEPQHISEEEVMNMQSQRDRGDSLWPPLVYLLRRREQIERQFRSYGRGHKISPKEFFQWAQYVQLDIHPEFHSHFFSPEASSQVTSTSGNENDLDPRIRSSMLKLIAAMAVGGYRYDPTGNYTNVVTEIVDDASLLGISITDDTVRKYLKLSAKMISKDWKPDNSNSDSD
ncbi:MAG: hypothetical protein AB3N07_04945 [Ruegeria sp.]